MIQVIHQSIRSLAAPACFLKLFAGVVAGPSQWL